jgi:plastocyanin
VVDTADKIQRDEIRIEEGRARWTRLAALGLVFVAAGPLLMLGAALTFGLDLEEFLGFLVVTSAVPLIGAYLVWRFGTWSKIVGILAALAPAVMLFWTAFGLAQPTSFFDFMPGVLVIPGALLAIVACVSAIVAGRRGHASATAVGGEMKTIRIALSVVVGLAVVSGGLTLGTRSTADAAGTAATVDMKDFEFVPDNQSVAGGSTILVKNSDPFHHTFTVEALDIDVDFGPRSSETIEIPARPGTYVIFCRPHTGTPDDPGENDMAGELTVE